MDMRIPLAFATVAVDTGRRHDHGARRIGLAAAVLLHAGLIVGVLLYTPVRHTLAKAAPLVVQLIATEPPRPVDPPKPPVARPVAHVAQPRAIEPVPVPVIAAPSPVTEHAINIPPPAAQPERSEQPVAVPPAPAPVAPEIVAPRFDAAYLDNPSPVYPPLARRAGEQGRVLLRVHVTADGQADDVLLRESSGSPRLDAAAQDAVRRWRFVPANQSGRAVAAWVIVPITFTLDRSRPA